MKRGWAGTGGAGKTYSFANDTYEAEVGVAADGRQTLTVHNPNCPPSRFNPKRWTRVRNIDGSNEFMLDDGGWEFLPRSNKPFMAAVEAALARAAHAKAGA